MVLHAFGQEQAMRGFIEELRHRNVFRVGVAYIIAGWLIAQVADLAADAFNAPDWLMQMLIIALLVGLPVSLFLAWAYELTPEGLMKADEVPADAPKDPRSGRALNIAIIAALTVAVLLLGWDKLQQPPTAVAMDRSIAVLPFEDFSPDGDHAWFAEGLTEEILNSLARTPDLLIASRTSSFAFRGTTEDIPTIAAQLDVAHILEGSVRRSGDRLRVTAQLIRATDDKHLWSENFDGSSDDSIEIQERIAFEIASALETAMDPEELAKMMSAGTRSVEAWETYLRGLALVQANSERGGGDAGAVFDVIAMFDKAVELDPGFADAHLMLADVWATQINPTSTQYIRTELSLAERQAHYNKAIAATIKYARSDMSRLEAEMRAAEFDLRIMDQIAAARGMTEVAPERRQGWSWLNYLYMLIGEDDKSREAGLKAWALPDEPGSGRAPIIQSMHRVSLEDTVRMVDEVLANPSPTPNILYQAHRALLAAGLVERAAALADDYVHISEDFEGKSLVQIRQACAEGRIADAESLFEDIDPNSNSMWLFLTTLGRDDEARDILMPLDTPQTVFVLSQFMTYRSFEARDYPVLWKALTTQGINRSLARPMAYQCER
jgi:TolB-like protein